MRRLFAMVLAVAVCFSVTACGTSKTPSSSEAGSSSVYDEGEVETVEFDDGSYTTIRRWENGTIREQTDYNSAGEITSKNQYTKRGQTECRWWFDEHGAPLGHSDMMYDENGIQTSAIEYDKDDNPVYTFEYVYSDETGFIKERTMKDAEGKLLSYIKFSDENEGCLELILIYDENQDIIEVTKYDADQNPTRVNVDEYLASLNTTGEAPSSSEKSTASESVETGPASGDSAAAAASESAGE